MHCKTCQYSLENLTEHRCPECGREFDPSDPKTYGTVSSKRSLLAVTTFCVLSSVGLFIAGRLHLDPVLIVLSTVLASSVFLAFFWLLNGSRQT